VADAERGRRSLIDVPLFVCVASASVANASSGQDDAEDDHRNGEEGAEDVVGTVERDEVAAPAMSAVKRA